MKNIMNIMGKTVMLMFLVVGVSFAAAEPDSVFWGGPASLESLKNVPEPIITQMENEGIAEFFIVLSEQADLSGAKQFRRKEDKGSYVFKQLVDVAERTQPQVIADLGLQNADIERFHIQNMILVRDGSPDMLLGAVNHAMVSAIRENIRIDFEEDQPMAYPDNAPGRGPEWNLSHIGITDVWAEGITGEGIVVANLDSGVQWDHPALKSKYRGWNGYTVNHDYNWHDGYSSSRVPVDTHGHGTHVMGTMVGDDGMGNQIGGAPGAKWIACRGLRGGYGSYCHKCLEWFLAPYKFGQSPSQGLPDKAPHVINNSWGSLEGGDYQFAPDIDALQAAGIFVEFSAGNAGDSCQTLGSPGDYPQVLTTGASDVQNRIVSQSWGSTWGSSRGPAKEGIPGAPDFIKPEIVAPGYDIRSCVPGNEYEGGWGGTSMAGPHTCAVIALMWSATPGLIGDIETTRQIILDNAYTEPGGAGYWDQICEGIDANTTIPNHVWGWGLLDAYACFQTLKSVYLDKSVYRFDDTIVITVLDRDASGSVQVKVKSTSETSWETVTLTKVSELRFEGTILTTSAPPVAGDGALSVAHGDTVTVWYESQDLEATASIDGVSPVISNVQVTKLRSKTFIVTWQTDEPARSIIMYGTSTPDTEERENVLTTDHTLTVTNLEPCTYYFFDILAEDFAGNEAVDDNGGLHYGIQTYDLIVIMEANMDTDPGWTYEPDWAWGRPTGQGGGYGSPDPTSGYTGDNVVGYNLDGNYENDMPSTKWATTQAFDCSEGTVVNLEFYVWLSVDTGWGNDDAYIDVSNDNGGSWTRIWANRSRMLGGAWEPWTFDISNVAAGKPQVKIRWGMGPTSWSEAFCGWNIDDVLLSIEKPCDNPTPTPQYTNTPPPQPTNTPTSQHTNTPTPQYTNTPPPKPTDTPVNTFTPNPPTNTPAQPSPTSTPAPSECEWLGTRLEISQNEPFQTGDIFWLKCNVCTDVHRANVPTAILLNVATEFWFWPSWSNSFDLVTSDYEPGLTSFYVFEPFTWPKVVGSATDIVFYSAFLTPELDNIVGEIGFVTFGYQGE